MTQFLLFHWANKSSNSYHQFFHIKLFCLSSLVFETQIYSLSSSFSTLNSIENYYPEKINMEKMFSRSQHDRQQSTTDWSWWFFFFSSSSDCSTLPVSTLEISYWMLTVKHSSTAKLSEMQKKVVCAEKFKSDEVIANLSPKNMEKWICRSQVWKGARLEMSTTRKRKNRFLTTETVAGERESSYVEIFFTHSKKLVHFSDEEKMSQFGSMTTKVAHVGWQTRVRNFFSCNLSMNFFSQWWWWRSGGWSGSIDCPLWRTWTLGLWWDNGQKMFSHFLGLVWTHFNDYDDDDELLTSSFLIYIFSVLISSSSEN